MLAAVCADLANVPGTSLLTMHDDRLGKPPIENAIRHPVTSHNAHQSQFDSLVAAADLTLLVAPESGGALPDLAWRVERQGGTLLGPDYEFIGLTSDKRATCQRLAKAGVPVPRSFACRTPHELSQLPDGPLVCKPNDGAGSIDICQADRRAIASWLARHPDMLVEEYCAGRPASVAALCNPNRRWILPPFWQDLQPPDFAYRGGSRIMEAPLIARAHDLARRTFEALPRTRGYVGIDLVLGPDDTGCLDRVIEVNPRLTTSYVGLRHLIRPNLAGAMIQAARDQTVDLSFLPGGLKFDAAGRVDRSDTPDHVPAEGGWPR